MTKESDKLDAGPAPDHTQRVSPAAADPKETADQTLSPSPKEDAAAKSSESVAKRPGLNLRNAPPPISWLVFCYETFKKNKFIGTIFFIFVAIIVVFPNYAQKVISWAGSLSCQHTGYFCKKPAEKEESLAISTATARCQTGYLNYALRHTKQAAHWGPGTENLLICADATVKALPENLLAASAKKFPRCLTSSQSGGNTTVNLNYASRSICRAPYRVINGQVVAAPYELGINVCIPESDRADLGKASGVFIIGSEPSQVVHECDQKVIRAFGFQ